jgi:hypothetical protein
MAVAPRSGEGGINSHGGKKFQTLLAFGGRLTVKELRKEVGSA